MIGKSFWMLRRDGLEGRDGEREVTKVWHGQHIPEI